MKFSSSRTIGMGDIRLDVSTLIGDDIDRFVSKCLKDANYYENNPVYGSLRDYSTMMTLSYVNNTDNIRDSLPLFGDVKTEIGPVRIYLFNRGDSKQDFKRS